MLQPLALGQQECAAYLGFEAVEHARDTLKQFQQQLAGFCRGTLCLRHMGQCLQVGPVQFLAAPVIDDQPTRYRAQERPRGVQLQVFVALQQADEGVMGQVCGIGGVAQLAAQPGV
ncbi:hypothetical protein D3C76_1107510 [compost metagenome]